MDEAQRLGEGAAEVALLRGVWGCMPPLALWERTREAKMAEKAETAETADFGKMAETAEVAEKADVAEKAEMGGESAVDRWRKSEERKALLQGLTTTTDAKDVAELEGVTDFDPRMFEVEAGT